jgi:hypothetical protein
VIFPWSELAGRERALARLSLLEPPKPPPDAEPPTGPYLFETHVVCAFRTAPLPLDAPLPGTYRLQVWERGSRSLLYEGVFFVPDGWPPRQDIQLARPRAEFLERAVRVERVELEIAGWGFYTIPTFRVLSEPVTTADLARFLAETGTESAEFYDTRAAQEPAAVSYDLAMRFAAWAGGRLPSYAELMLAHERGAIVLPLRSPLSEGEFVLDAAVAHAGSIDPGYLSYERRVLSEVSVRDRPLAQSDLPVVPTDPPFAGFRVVFASDDPALYRELARQPIR